MRSGSEMPLRCSMVSTKEPLGPPYVCHMREYALLQSRSAPVHPSEPGSSATNFVSRGHGSALMAAVGTAFRKKMTSLTKHPHCSSDADDGENAANDALRAEPSLSPQPWG